MTLTRPVRAATAVVAAALAGAGIASIATEHKQFSVMLTRYEYRDSADPFLVALAYTRGATVVTDENQKQWHLPFLCRLRNVPALNRFSFMRAEGWTF